MWSALYPVVKVVDYIKSDVQLNSWCTFQRLFMSVVFLVCSVVPVLDVFTLSQIECIMDSPDLLPAISSYCLINGKFTNSKSTVNPHAYYVWVPYMMVICFLLSQTGYGLYQLFSGGILNTLLRSMESLKNDKHYDKLLTYFRIKSDALAWAPGFIISEIVAFITPVFLFYFLNMFLEDQFLLLGIQNSKSLNQIFPKEVKCTFQEYGPSGTIKNLDSLCLLPRNFIYDKIFFCIWWCLVISATLSVLGFIYRLLTIFCFRLSFFNQALWIKASLPLSKVSRNRLVKLSKTITFYEWLYIYYVHKNSQSYMTDLLLENCCKELIIEDDDEADLPLVEFLLEAIPVKSTSLQLIDNISDQDSYKSETSVV